MDDETFKSEVLARLQQIMEMLTSILPEACVEEAEQDLVPGTVEPLTGSAPYSIGEEMQENYRSAIEKWQQQRGGA